MAFTGKAKVAGVMGWPIAHSKSPQLHGYWLKQYGIDGAYVPFAVHPDRVEQAIRALPALGLRGANVTVPFKEKALAIAEIVTPTARRIGAANTLTVLEDGRIHADNTDAFGFTQNLAAGAPDWQAAAAPAVVIGAGGAARSVLVALRDAGVPVIRLINRTTERAAALADELGPGIEVVNWSERSQALAGAGLLVNTTTLGMAGHPPLELALEVLPTTALVTDIVYTPLETPLLAGARARGLAVVDGLGMLLHQGRPGFARWFGVEPEVTPALRARLLGGS